MKIHLRTFGCRANQYDSEQMRAMFERAGAEIVADAADADVAVFNSCAVTSDAEADLRQAVRRAARGRPGLRTVITGCAAARSPGTLAELPSVEGVIPGADLPAVADALGLPADAAFGTAKTQRGARGLLRVQDGCDEHCTFCATTLARGAHRSRTADELVAEAKALAGHHEEIVLTGVHVGSWGKEFGNSLGALVARLVRDVPRVRFRLASVEATEVDALLAEMLRDGGSRVCPYLHAPLQSASDSLLRRMGRHWYTGASYAAAIDRLTAGRPTFGLGADIVAGFPGETAADHAATLALVRDLPFTHLHVFPYSPRPGTAAVRLGDAVPPALARERAAELRALGEAKGAAYRASRVGAAAEVVVISGAPRRDGLTEDYLPVTVEGTAARGSRFRALLEAGPAGSLLIRPPSPHPRA
ncbi:MAG: MiaB/RimO family radical SAM methylthiotransferase [Gemmatimonadaceae bacterium]